MKGLLMYVCVCVTKGLLCLNILIKFNFPLSDGFKTFRICAVCRILVF